MPDHSLWLVAFAYGAATFAALVAATALGRRRVDDASRPAARAVVLFWGVGAGLTALQAVEAIVLFLGAGSLRFMIFLSFTTATMVAVAVTALVYYAYFLARGAPPPVLLLALVGGALFLGGTWNSAGLIPGELVDERLFPSLVARSTVSLLVWALIVAVPLFCIIPLALASRRAIGRAAERARLVAGGLTAAVAGPILAPWFAPSARPGIEVVGIVLAALAIIVAYAGKTSLTPLAADA